MQACNFLIHEFTAPTSEAIFLGHVTDLHYVDATSELPEQFPEGGASTTGVTLQEMSCVDHPLTFLFSLYNKLEAQFDVTLHQWEYSWLRKTINLIKRGRINNAKMEMGERIMGKEVRRRIMNFRHIEEKLVFQDVLPRRSQNRENPVILVISGNETDSTQYPQKLGNYDLVYRSLKDTTSSSCYFRQPEEKHYYRYDSKSVRVKKVFSTIAEDASKTLVLFVYLCTSSAS